MNQDLDNLRMLTRWERGDSVDDIGEEFGVSKTTVYRRLRIAQAKREAGYDPKSAMAALTELFEAVHQKNSRENAS